jgi:hydroxyethylthiazole kinase-like uncharacterized protein yjeF
MNELLTPEQMGKADRLTIEAGPFGGMDLMRRAGSAVAAVVLQRYPAASPVHVLCGPGNNGGDGYVVAKLLHEAGVSVRLWALGRPRAGTDAAIAAAEGPIEPKPLAGFSPAPGSVVVDALFGAGLSKAIDADAAKAIEKCTRKNVPVIAVDLPSGVSGDSGKILGSAFRADITVTFFRKKPGHLLLPGRELCGEIVLADIGIPAEAAHTQLHENTSALWRYPFPKPTGHKYDRGHAVIVSGGAHQTGAARLAARGALRVGAGLVSVASPPDALAVNATHLTAIMLKTFDGAAGLAKLLEDKRLNAVALGPGLGVGGETRALVDVVLKSGAAVVLDADALTSFQDDPEALFNRLHDARLQNKAVLTPHAGEFARIFPGLLDDAPSKVDAARTAAARAGCTVILKGNDTVIADASGRAAINGDAPAWLATAGAGDVLAGFVAGLLAQGMTAFDAAACAVWLHGAAAAAFGPGLIAEDLPEALPQVLRRLRPD